MRARTRKKGGGRKPRLPAAAGLLIYSISLLVLIIGGLYFLSLPLWQIREVVVRGTKILSSDEIVGLAGIPISENLFFYNLSRTRANLHKMPAIKKFWIYRIPPSTILIRVKEREPVAIIAFRDKTAIIDRDGFVLNWNSSLTLNIPDLADLPVVSGVNEREALKKERVDERLLEIVEDIIVKLSQSLGARRISLSVKGFEDINLLLDDILKVKVGDANNIKEKMGVFEALLPQITGKWTQVEYVDVRLVDNPVIKYK